MSRRSDRLVFPALALSALLLAGGCGKSAESSEAGESATAVATIRVAPVDRGPVQETIEAFGTIDFDPQRSRSVVFVKAGQVARILVTPGQPVGKGDPLLTFGPLPEESPERVKAAVDLKFATSNLDRVRRLLKAQLATNEQVQLAEREVAAASAALEGLGVSGRVEPERVLAPFAGIVAKQTATEGAIVHPGDEALLLAPERGLVVIAGFEQEDAAKLRPGQEAEVSPVFRARGASSARATLTRLHKVVDPASQLVEALIQPEAPAEWMAAGTRVRVRIAVRGAPASVRLPREALLTRDGVLGVFVVADATAHWRPVRTGLEEDAFVEAIEGVQPGDLVATGGRSSLGDGMRVQVERGEAP